MFRNKLKEIQAQTDAEKAWWEKRRASIQTEFMKELDTPEKSAKTPSKASSDEDTVLVESGGPAASSTGSIGKKRGKK